MFSTLVSGLEHCIGPIYRTLVAIEEVSDLNSSQPDSD